MINQKWPAEDSPAPKADITALFAYLRESKSEFRLAFDKAKSGGKKAKKAKNAAPEETKPIESCTIFIGIEFPEYKKKVLEILQSLDFDDSGKCLGDHVKAIREGIKGP